MGDFEYSRQWDERQLEVVTLQEGETLVLAPPGCGKTEILAERARLAINRGLRPAEMVCLAFTNRAAREMNRRVDGLAAEEMFVGNLHRFSSSFLFGNNLVAAGAAVIDDEDLNDILTEFLPDHKLESLLVRAKIPDGKMIRYLVKFDLVRPFAGLYAQWTNTRGEIRGRAIGQFFDACRRQVAILCNLAYQVRHEHAKAVWLDPLFDNRETAMAVLAAFDALRTRGGSDYGEIADMPFVREVVECAVRFEGYCKANGLLTFDDLILRTYTAYLNDTSRRLPRYRWLQVDEVQDLNPLQIALVDELKANEEEGFDSMLLLGDEQQAIFSFLGAKLDTLGMLKERCDKLLRLNRNYRSPAYLVNLYNKYAAEVLGADISLLPMANNGDEGMPDDKMLFGFAGDESTSVIKRALPYYLKLAADDDLACPAESPHRTAILVPTNALADRISEDLDEAGISHFKISGTDIFSSSEYKGVLAHMSMQQNDHSYMSWARLLWLTGASPTLAGGRALAREMRRAALTPVDLLTRPGSSQTADFRRRWEEEEVVVFDTETTGLDVFNDDIVQIAAVKLSRGEVVGELNLLLHTDKEIPAMLGDIENPLVREYAAGNHVARSEGLLKFLDFCEGCAVAAHNARFDYHILDFNMRRDCGISDVERILPECFDTLVISRSVYPNLAGYKLKQLGHSLGLEGSNTHLADDDTRLTVNLCRNLSAKAVEFQGRQLEFFESHAEAVARFRERYSDLYQHTKSRLYAVDSVDTGHFSTRLASEMDYVCASLFNKTDKRKEEKLQKVFGFVDSEVVDPEWGPSLCAQLAGALPMMSTFREADLCSSGVVQERVFVSTVHKAKGLEFQNVIVASVVNGVYPFFKSDGKRELMLEDARKLYVALSRAKKRLCLTYAQVNPYGYPNSVAPFLSPVKDMLRCCEDK